MARLRSDGDPRLVSRATEIPTPSPRAFLQAATGPRAMWDAPDEPTMIATGAAAELTASGAGRFSAIRDAAGSLFADRLVDGVPEVARPRLFGGFSFHAGADRDPTDSPWEGFPDAQFVLPRVQLTSVPTDERDAPQMWLTVNAVDPVVDEATVEQLLDAERRRIQSLPDPGSVGEPPGIESRTRTMARSAWRESVREVLRRIEAGDLQKVVLAQALETTLGSELSIPDVLARLRERSPGCYRFLVEPSTEEGGPTPAFFGATPEGLVQLRGRTLLTDALAGTIGRGATRVEDERLAAELQHSQKDVHEHELVVETIRDQLDPFTSAVACGERSVRRLSTVQHLWTPITAKLAADSHVLSIVEALHPTPAVGGLAPDAALETIRGTEPFDRGWYAAPVGWFDAAGDGSFAVALRSAVARGRTATLFAGVGIVEDSDPDREWEEVQLKYRPILEVLERPQ